MDPPCQWSQANDARLAGVEPPKKIRMCAFDVCNLLDFSTSGSLCAKCLAIDSIDYATGPPSRPGFCSVCGLRYVATDDYAPWEVETYLERERGLWIEFDDPIAHGKAIAESVRYLRRRDRSRSDIRILFDLLQLAKKFVHFMTFTIDPMVVGALKLLSQNVPVRGIVGKAADWPYTELVDHHDEFPKLSCHAFRDDGNSRQVPHQKLIVIDGLVAIDGSPNLGFDAWRNISGTNERIDIVTEIEKIRRLHNDNFSVLWARHSPIRDRLEMRRRKRDPPRGVQCR
jgi:phosphatidylserine/phosphatidylglycerophosphate/cardiolipin synthase-like enzyme